MPDKQNTKNNNSNLPLIIILAICLVVLSALVVLVLQKFKPVEPSVPAVNTDPQSPQAPQTIEIPDLQNMNLQGAKDILSELGVEFEIVPTESRIANRVEKITGYTVDENGKMTVNTDSKIVIHSNEVAKDKVIYLTFDDGPMVNYSDSALTDIYYTTEELLTVLDEYNVKATFFLAGYQMVKSDRKHFVNDIYDRGHLIACHTYSHELTYIYNSVDNFLVDVEKFETALIEILGEEKFNSFGKYIRFPGGSSTNGCLNKSEALEYIESIRNKGYKVYDWTTLTGDAEGVTDAQGMINYIISNLDSVKQKGEPLILLMHDKKAMKDALPEVLDYLISEGYYFDTLDTCEEYTSAENLY